MMCGGSSEAKEATADIQALVEQVRPGLEEKFGSPFSQFKAVLYKSQVVAGTNYFVKIQVGDGEYIHARIFQSLPHAGSTVQLHSHQTNKSRDDALDYF